jgi:lipoprotein-anchoring transpeptidase ErfK/SrfK
VAAVLAVLALAPAASAGGSAAPGDEPAQISSDERGTTYWSTVNDASPVRAAPRRSARRTGSLKAETYYRKSEVVIVLEESGDWSRVRYSGLGNRTGWVPSTVLDEPRLTRSWVTIDLDRRQLVAHRGDRTVLRAPVGVGMRGNATPSGSFFIRERLVPASKRGPYGVLAFGLSAYSRHHTGWPGGGQVGIHGTNQPGLIPGRISHGCVRMRNKDVLKLDRLVRPGTPVAIG